MQVEVIKTRPITTKDTDLFALLDKYLPSVPERCILAITSKVVAISQGRLVQMGAISKEQLVEEESEYYLPSDNSKYGISLSIKNNILIPTAGIDESNGNGYYILWPEKLQETANQIREHLRRRFSRKEVGVIITDSKTTPLRWGTTGVSLAHSGFRALNTYIGKPDIFGKEMQVTKANIMDALAAAAVVCMGEGAEQTPFALLNDLPFVNFQEDTPSEAEIKELHIPLSDDLYAPMLEKVEWKRGKGA